MKEDELLEELHPLERKVLPLLAQHTSVAELVKHAGLQEVEVMRAVQWLRNKHLVSIEKKEEETLVLDKNGETYRKEGLPELRLLKALTKPCTIQELQKKASLQPQEVQVSLGLLKRKQAIATKKTTQGLVVTRTEQGAKQAKESVEQDLLKHLPKKVTALAPEERHAFSELSKRKAIVKKEVKKNLEVTLTERGKKLVAKGVQGDSLDTLTPELLKKKAWKNKKFRRYDVSSPVPEITIGKKHFENQVIDYVKRIWLSLGFQEMTGNMTQSAFWDLDALFVPQDHPAREEQDTFYIQSYQEQPDNKLMNKIKAMHEHGSTISKGWGGTWKEEVARQMLLRTHSTVLSARTLYALKEKAIPGKFFSVGKVFRNETLDWKHSFEFYQVEGIVVGEKATLRDLKGYLKEFFGRMGYPDVRMRPGHFPYTEPSMEVDVWNPEKKEWVELGGSGIFRPEVVVPLLGKEIPVLAWGLGLSRLFDYFNISDIRDINKNDLHQLRHMKRWLR